MKEIWSDLGGKLGVGLISAGFLAIFLGWNGAASVDRVQSQFPYLISGGLAGLSLVVCGIGLIVVQNQREDRAALQQTVRELRDAIAEAGLAEPVGETRREFQLPPKRPTPPSMFVDPSRQPEPDIDDDLEEYDDERADFDDDTVVLEEIDDEPGDRGPARRRRKLRAN